MKEAIKWLKAFGALLLLIAVIVGLVLLANAFTKTFIVFIAVFMTFISVAVMKELLWP